MQPETVQQHRPDPWPFGPVRGTDGSADPSRAHLAARLAGPGAHPAGPGPHPAAEPAAPGAEEADALVARLRARRSASGVAAAYAAAHGHPADPRPEHGARRWALTGTTAVVAVVAVLLLGLGVAAFSMRGDGIETLAPLAGSEPSASAGSGGAPSRFAGAGPVPSIAPDAGDAAPTGGGLLVHVVGAVVEPGLVTVPDGARVADALQAAGGATRKADLTALNLARTVVDGEQLYVPAQGESVPGAPVAPGAGGQGTPGDQAAGGDVDINAADALALEALPGVGPSIAQAIVEWREANGPFASVDELEDVPGIGPATLDEIRDSARVGP